MKKIAFMFAAAAMVVACGNEVALTADDSAAVQKAVEDSLTAEVAKIAAPVMDTEAENQDSAKTAYDEAVAKYSKDTAAIFAGRDAALTAGYEKALADKKNAGEEKKDSAEQK